MHSASNYLFIHLLRNQNLCHVMSRVCPDYMDVVVIRSEFHKNPFWGFGAAGKLKFDHSWYCVAIGFCWSYEVWQHKMIAKWNLVIKCCTLYFWHLKSPVYSFQILLTSFIVTVVLLIIIYSQFHLLCTSLNYEYSWPVVSVSFVHYLTFIYVCYSINIRISSWIQYSFGQRSDVMINDSNGFYQFWQTCGQLGDHL